MRTILVISAAICATVCSFAATTAPASANEARIEARGGVIWTGSGSEGTLGAAAGYDFDLGDTLFAGPEVSADKILDDDARVSFGFGGRVGAKIGERGKLYAASSYQTKFCSECEDAVSVGGGYQHAFTDSIYAKVEYRHFFIDNGFSDADTVVAGLGLKF
ncbi:outer membrane protein [Novosphingobium aquimarinum]|uniref:outer membrane protein n=1 Tax=Novosphingobium aquimarinum TaxID=2682494 RepID=UPI0012EB44D3|nr:hypothetical protein [Novosphingobium aquimarinum]